MFKLSKKILDGKLTPEEKKFIQEQSGDIARLILTGTIVVAIPGGTVIIPALAKLGFPIVPSSFKEEKDSSIKKINF